MIAEALVLFLEIHPASKDQIFFDEFLLSFIGGLGKVDI
jgi:hypothetical protein